MDDLPPKLYTVPVRNVMMPIVEHHVSFSRLCVCEFYEWDCCFLLAQND